VSKPKSNTDVTPVRKVDVRNRQKFSKSEASNLVAKAQAGDNKARETLCDRYSYLISHFTERLDAPSTLLQKLHSAGSEALHLAIDEYKTNDPEHFTVYAHRWIRRRVHLHFRRITQTANVKQPCLSAYQHRVASHTNTILTLGTPLKKLLSSREYEVIQHRFALDGNSRKTLAQIAAVMNISRQWVCKLEHQALSKIINFSIK
jgi:RNA polymerase sporulation-specific sigma factor